MPGRTPAVNSGDTATSCTSEHPSQLTEHQLEELLAGKQLDRERELLKDSQTSFVTASEEQTEAVGKLLYMQVQGVPVDAMLDTGSQSTIILCSTLHVLNMKLQQEGKKLPPLELPTAQLYGKDRPKGGHELVITAQIPFFFC